MHKLSFHFRPNSLSHVHWAIFTNFSTKRLRLRRNFWKNLWKLIFIWWRARSLCWFYHQRKQQNGSAHQTRQEQNLPRNVDGKMEDCSDQQWQERGSDLLGQESDRQWAILKKRSVIMFLGLLESPTWIIIGTFSWTISSHLLIWCETSKQDTSMLVAPFALTGKTTLLTWSEWS